MNKGIYLFLVLLLFSAGAVIAQEGQSEIPEGMEVLQDGTLKVIVPKDAVRRQERNLTLVESTDAYLLRRFLRMEERFDELEAKVGELEQEIDQLKKTLDEVNEKLAAFTEEEKQEEAKEETEE